MSSVQMYHKSITASVSKTKRSTNISENVHKLSKDKIYSKCIALTTSKVKMDMLTHILAGNLKVVHIQLTLQYRVQSMNRYYNSL